MRTVLLTGATGKLGTSIAKKFSDNGDFVIGINKQNYDLSSQNQLECLVRNYNDIDILINNAGIQGPIGPIQTNNWEEWQKCIYVNLMAPVFLMRAFIPGMINRNYGRIINISGGGATTPRPDYSSYATAKTGLVRFSETLAYELSGTNITVNCVSPGAMISAMTIGQNIKENYNEKKASSLIYALTTDAYSGVTGQLISAIWDNWKSMECKGTLRRIK